MKNVVRYKLFITIAITILFTVIIPGCEHDHIRPSVDTKDDLTSILFQPTPFELPIPSNYPKMPIPADNPLTEEGIYLGKKLFYDPILSRDSTISCASCHLQEHSFKDPAGISTGVDQRKGRRTSMNLINVGYNQDRLFWDGRSSSLEDQVTGPVEDPNELDHDWPSIESLLRTHADYPKLFRKAFGIQSEKEINKDLISKAIAQFERTLIGSGTTRYDLAIQGKIELTQDELEGYMMFTDASPGLYPDAECAHCHAEPLFTTFEFKNNGLETIDNLEDFLDRGRGEVTGQIMDNGKFKIPTLYNAAISPPYMHDGRFDTLEEVMDHYNSGGHRQPNTDPLIRPLGLTEKQKQQVIAFVKTLTDTVFLQNPAFNPPSD